jgi:signal transduction histidine kinase
MELWEARVRAALPAVQKQDPLALRNAVPLVLDALAEGLAGRSMPFEDIFREHGHQRAHLIDYELEYVRREYLILRDIIWEVLESDEKLNAEERECIVGFIANGLWLAASEFAALQLAKQVDISDQLRLVGDIREQFVATLTHDLRNPLGAARAAEHLLSQYGASPEVRQKALKSLKSSIDHAELLIRNLLDVNQIRGGRPLSLEMAEGDLRQVVDEAVREMSSTHGDRFIVECPVPVKGVWSAYNVRRALDNLIENAVKYGSQSTPVTVTVRRAGDEVQLSVHNEGSPIPPEEQTHIFDPFYRVSSPTASARKGWGLGLPLVKGVVDAHGGRIEVRSSAVEGTTFTIHLPVAVVATSP